jgi:hypothetical protein
MTKQDTQIKPKRGKEIRVTDIPASLSKRIAENAKSNKRSAAKEVLLFLEQNY